MAEYQSRDVGIFNFVVNNWDSFAVIPDADHILSTLGKIIKKYTYGLMSIFIHDMVGSLTLLSAAFTKQIKITTFSYPGFHQKSYRDQEKM